MKRILIVGATSAIAEAVAREFAARGDALYLAGRSMERLQAIAADLKVRGATNTAYGCFDARETQQVIALVEQAAHALGGLDTVLIAHGTLSNQKECEQSAAKMLEEFATNAGSVMVLCTEVANLFEAQGHGAIAVISSVAGDRGRQSNYVYGTAKATVTAFTSGLRQRLHAKGVKVITIKPGFVDTPMTASFKKGALWATAPAVAKSIVRAIDRGSHVVYVPGFWRLIMFIIRSIPETIFQKLKL